MSTRDEIIMRMQIAKAKRDENTVRHLLGQWVSELEPSIAMRDGEIIGLCVAGDPTGSIPVRVMDMRPVLREMMRLTGLPDDPPTVTFACDLGYD